MSRTADGLHPAAVFTYYAAVILLAMLYFNPVYIALGILFAVLHCLVYIGGKSLVRHLLFGLPAYALIAVLNPVVSHGGRTVLFRGFGMRISLESLFYGACSGAMLLLVLLWFSVYNRVVTAEKFMFLFSRAAASSAMLVTMAQRMVPLFLRRLKAVRAAQKTLGGTGSAKNRFSGALREISILMSWSMEEGLDTADSMKSRGYGSRRRSHFSLYRFTARDTAFLAATVFLAGISAAGYYTSVSEYFYPVFYLRIRTAGYLSLSAYAVLCLLPLAAEAARSAVFIIRYRQPVNNTRVGRQQFESN